MFTQIPCRIIFCSNSINSHDIPSYLLIIQSKVSIPNVYIINEKTSEQHKEAFQYTVGQAVSMHSGGVFGLLLFVYEFGNCVTSGSGTRQATNQLNWEKRWIYWTDVDTRAGAPQCRRRRRLVCLAADGHDFFLTLFCIPFKLDISLSKWQHVYKKVWRGQQGCRLKCYLLEHVSKGFFVTPCSLRRGTRAVNKRGNPCP